MMLFGNVPSVMGYQERVKMAKDICYDCDGAGYMIFDGKWNKCPRCGGMGEK